MFYPTPLLPLPSIEGRGSGGRVGPAHSRTALEKAAKDGDSPVGEMSPQKLFWLFDSSSMGPVKSCAKLGGLDSQG